MASCAIDGQYRTSPVGEMDRHEAICWPSVVKTVINDALWPISQFGSISSRHWLMVGRRFGVRMGISVFGGVIFVSLYCHTSNFRPDIAHAQPLSEQLIVTLAFRSLNISASFTAIGSCSPNDWATLLADRAITWFDWTDRPETLYRLQIKILPSQFRLCFTHTQQSNGKLMLLPLTLVFQLVF